MPTSKTPRKSAAKPKAAKRTATRKSTAKPTEAGRPASKTAVKTAKPGAQAGAPDWRPAAIDRVRKLILQADPEVVEQVKWRKPSNAMQGVPTWSHDGLICTGETYKDKVKFTFARGAALDDPAGLFNADDRGATRRAIDLREGEDVDPVAFRQLVKDAVAANQAKGA